MLAKTLKRLHAIRSSLNSLDTLTIERSGAITLRFYADETALQRDVPSVVMCVTPNGLSKVMGSVALQVYGWKKHAEVYRRALDMAIKFDFTEDQPDWNVSQETAAFIAQLRKYLSTAPRVSNTATSLDDELHTFPDCVTVSFGAAGGFELFVIDVDGATNIFTYEEEIQDWTKMSPRARQFVQACGLHKQTDNEVVVISEEKQGENAMRENTMKMEAVIEAVKAGAKTRSAIGESLGLDPKGDPKGMLDITKVLNLCVGKGLLARHGAKRGTHYTLPALGGLGSSLP
jgi:hypothetical protein